MFTRWIVVNGWDNFPHGEGGIVLAPNHPSLLDPLIMVALFHKAYSRQPELFGPYTFADTENYTKNNWWSKFNQRLLPIMRPEKDWSEERLRQAHDINTVTLQKARRILKGNGNVIIFAEGGRTPSSTERIPSQNGKELRPLHETAALLARLSSARIAPVWIRITWGPHFRFRSKDYWIPKRIYLSCGKPITVSRTDEDKVVTRRIEQVLLTLANDAS